MGLDPGHIVDDGLGLVADREPVEVCGLGGAGAGADVHEAFGAQLGGLEGVREQSADDLVGEELHAAVGVVDDEPLLRAQQLVRDHEGPDGVVGRASPGVTDDVRIAFAEPGVLGGVQPGVHAGEDGEAARGRNELARMRNAQSRGDLEDIDVLLAQRYAGAAGLGNSTVTIEWDDVDELTPWRYGLAAALGMDIPDRLLDDAGPYYQRVSASLPSLPLALRVDGARRAAREGIFSSAALIDLYSQAYAAGGNEGSIGTDAAQLRTAYVDPDPAARVAAIRALWGDDAQIPYDRQVLTAYAAARIPAGDQFSGDAAPLIAAMLAAGLDLDAARWSDVVDEGDAGWGMLAVGLPNAKQPVSNNAIDSFSDNDSSTGRARTGLLVAGLAGLGRISSGTRNTWDRELGLELGRETAWSKAIGRAGAVRNAALVSLLMGLGMQGDDWSRMTPRHLYYIVSALRQSGLEAEARMIAAEAIARG